MVFNSAFKGLMTGIIALVRILPAKHGYYSGANEQWEWQFSICVNAVANLVGKVRNSAQRTNLRFLLQSKKEWLGL